MGSAQIKSTIKIVTQQEQKGVYVAQFKIQSLAIFSYYIESQKECYLIDPTYDYLFYQDFIKKRGTTLKYVLLTHYHADFISAHGIFNVPVIMGEKSKREANKFMLIEMKDNQKFKIGKVQTKIIATPGHTTESSSFILANEDGKEFCIFTGDTVFLKEVGRPDLAVSGTLSSADLASMLYDSIQKIKALDKSLRLYPGHGSGSSCGKSIGAGNFCDLKTQAELNYAFLIPTRQQFIEKLTKDLPAPPKYFFYDAKINQQGPQIDYQTALNRVKKPLTVKEFQDIAKRGITIVDTRDQAPDGIIKGAFWLAHSGPMCNLASNLSDPEKQFVLLCSPQKQQEVIQRFLRIGFLNILGYGDFKMSEWTGPKIKPYIKKWQQINPASKKAYIDVRNKPEWIESGVMQGALTISLPEIGKRIKQVQQFISKNKDSQIVIHCKGGMRARFGSSIILNNDLLQSIVVLNENIEKIHEKGVKLVPYQEK